MLSLLPSVKLILELVGWSCITGLGLSYYLEDNSSLTERTIKQFFTNTGLYIKQEEGKKILPQLLEYKGEGEKQELYIYSMPNGLSLSEFENKKKALEHQLKGELELWAIDNKLYIRLYSHELPNRANFTENMDFILRELKKTKFGLSVGFSKRGYIVNDFSKATCHIVLGGQTGAGKSILLRQLILSGMLAYSHHELQYYFVDLKGGVEMVHFKKSAHTQKIAETHQETLNILTQLNKEVDERLRYLKSKSVTSLYDLKNTSLPKKILVIDELAELQGNDECIELLERLLRLARATGIHIVTATQRPDRNVLLGQLKANLPVSVALKCKNDVNSMILLDNSEGAYLENVAGRGIYQLNQNIKIQVPFLSVNDTRKLIKLRNIQLGYKPSAVRDFSCINDIVNKDINKIANENINIESKANKQEGKRVLESVKSANSWGEVIC